MPAYPDDASSDIAASMVPLTSDTAVSAVATRLLETFTSGSIEPGTRLPPERALAMSLGVGRSAVREALAALEILGIVQVRPGSGTYLRGSVSELLPQTLSWGLMLGQPRTEDLIEVRSALEIYAARLAASRISADALARLGGHLDEMRSSGDEVKVFVEADLQFHSELARSVGNVVLLDLLQSIRALLRVWADRAVHDPDDVRLALTQHESVFAAIAAADQDAAASAMAIHMDAAGRRLRNEIS